MNKFIAPDVIFTHSTDLFALRMESYFPVLFIARDFLAVKHKYHEINFKI